MNAKLELPFFDTDEAPATWEVKGVVHSQPPPQEDMMLAKFAGKPAVVERRGSGRGEENDALEQNLVCRPCLYDVMGDRAPPRVGRPFTEAEARTRGGRTGTWLSAGRTAGTGRVIRICDLGLSAGPETRRRMTPWSTGHGCTLLFHGARATLGDNLAAPFGLGDRSHSAALEEIE